MAACLITSISLLSLFYILKLIKRKFKDEYREKIKKKPNYNSGNIYFTIICIYGVDRGNTKSIITILTTLIFVLGYALYVKKFRNIKK